MADGDKRAEHPDQWNCRVCKENQWDIARNCDGKHAPTAIKIIDDVFDRCPVSMLDAGACADVAIIEACEGGGLGGSSILPSQFLSETQYFHNVRQIVHHEKWKIEKKKDKDKHGRNH